MIQLPDIKQTKNKFTLIMIETEVQNGQIIETAAPTQE